MSNRLSAFGKNVLLYRSHTYSTLTLPPWELSCSVVLLSSNLHTGLEQHPRLLNDWEEVYLGDLCSTVFMGLCTRNLELFLLK